jgi:ABC-type Na+ transport system ATPase subunit NatA
LIRASSDAITTTYIHAKMRAGFSKGARKKLTMLLNYIQAPSIYFFPEASL